MKKVILKVKIKDWEEFEQRLTDVDLDFGPVFWQHDRIYLPRGYKPGINFPRLTMRTEMRAVDRPPRYELILKRHIEDSGVDIVNRTLVRDYTETVNIIHQLGFEKNSEISRRRQAVLLGTDVHIFIDQVDGVPGYYLKMETRIEEDEKIGEVMKDLRRTLLMFGQDERTATNKAYFEMSEKGM